MKPTRSIPVALAGRSYRIDIGRGLLDDPSSFADLARAKTSVAAIVTNDVVAPLYAERLESSLAPHVRRVVRIVLPDGEATKTLATFERIESELLAAGLDRRSLVVALGGGVVGDLAGFAAGCFQRGIDFVQVPTTLLAQVDSSVGGKTGVNHPAGKNMVGVFHQPKRVVVDLETLETLPRREFAAGIAEIVKIAAVADAAFLDRIESRLTTLIDRDPGALVEVIARACELKAGIVGEDEREEGRRAVLNLGHTFGHAIETASGYGAWLHGEAIGCGLVLAADLSVRLGLLERGQAERLGRIAAGASLPTTPPPIPLERWLSLMRGDKKAAGGELRFVLLHGIGRAVVRTVSERVLCETLDAFGVSGTHRLAS